MNSQDKNKKRRLKWSRLILIITLLVFLAGIGAATGLFAASLRDLPPMDKGLLVPASATRVYDKNGELITRIGTENRIPVGFDKIPEPVQEAFLAAEDHRFYEHHGVSFKAILRAAWNDIINREIVEGGSTITQQLVKNTYLSPDKKFKRKIQEVILSFKVERDFSKEEIFNMYLNRIYLGEGTYGVQAASQKYFNKDIEEITTLNEAATLAALPKAPSLYSPFQNYDTAKDRRNLILDNMVEYGLADKEEVEEAKEQEIPLEEGNKEKNDYPYPYFMDHVVHELIDRYGDERVFMNGLNVYTTIDPEMQSIAQRELSNNANYPYSSENENGIIQPQGAMVILDPSSGEVRALVGGREHSHKRGLNRATRHRQPGSAFKPVIAYGPAVELEGMSPASVIDDIPVQYPQYSNYSPHNFDWTYRGLITMRTALTHSVNVAAVKVLMNHVSIPDAINFAQKLGINLSANDNGPSMALGGLYNGVTPLQLAGAYGAFANQGVYNEPVVITEVRTSDGQILDEYQPSPVQAMKPSTAFLITDMLKSVVTSGTGTGARIDRPMAGKTGTTEDNKDIWFAGYTPDYVGTVWMGHDDPTTMSGAYGGTHTARVWRKVMSEVHKDIPKHNFQKPANIVTATVDSKSGLLPGPNTPEEHTVTDYFARGTVPTETDDLHVEVEVCAESGNLPTEYCPDRITKVKLKLPYDVPDKVEDSDLRVPNEKCKLHGPGDSFLPPDEDGFTDEPIEIPGEEDENGDNNDEDEDENREEEEEEVIEDDNGNDNNND